MRPLSLTLEGFIGILSGQAKNSIHVDLTTLPEDAQLIAISGVNGAGKTTIIDNLHPYRVMPSQAKNPTPTSFSYYEHIVPGVDAVKDLIFVVNDKVYRSTLRMKVAGKSKKQECYLFVEDGQGGWSPYENTDTGLKSTGGAEAYDQCVEDLIGKPEIFFSTVFSAQRRKQVSSMTTSDVKALFSAMQGNDHLKANSEKSNEVVKALKSFMLGLQAQSAPLNGLAVKRIELTSNISERKSLLEGRRAEFVALENDIASQRGHVGDLEQLSRTQEAVKVQRQSLLDQHQALVSQNKAQLTAYDESLQASYATGSSHLQHLRLAVQSTASSLAECRNRVKELSSIAARKAQLDKMKIDLQQLIDSKSQVRMKIDECWVDGNRLSTLRQMATSLREMLSKTQAEGEGIKAILLTAKEIAGLIDVVPCKGHQFSQTCPLLEQARGELQKIPAAEAQVVQLRNSYRVNNGELASTDAELMRLQDKEVKLRSLQEQEQKLEDQISKLKDALSQAASVALAIADLPDANVKLQKANQDFELASLELSRFESEQAEVVGKNRDSREAFVKIHRDQEAVLLGQIAALPTPVSLETIDGERLKLSRLIERHQTVADSMEILTLELQGFEQELAKSLDALRQIGEVEAKVKVVSNEITQWTLLSKALGNDGIIAMSIDDAGPSISAITNKLLEDCYGGRFAIRISTQEATATGVLKESFEIHVEDTTRGTSAILDYMSGGETVWINECLVRAMALFMDQSSGSRYETLFSDESDGPLDEQRKRQFMTMKRAVLARGGYKREYIITQTSALRNMCDGVIDVSTL